MKGTLFPKLWSPNLKAPKFRRPFLEQIMYIPFPNPRGKPSDISIKRTFLTHGCYLGSDCSLRTTSKGTSELEPARHTLAAMHIKWIWVKKMPSSRDHRFWSIFPFTKRIQKVVLATHILTHNHQMVSEISANTVGPSFEKAMDRSCCFRVRLVL